MADKHTSIDGAPSQPDQSGQPKKRTKSSTLRAIVAAAVFVVVAIGLAFHTGTGTLSAFGWDSIAAICPLGALESIFGGWAFVPRAIIALLAVALIVVIAGKAFCSWICPIPHISSLFKSKKAKKREEDERRQAALNAVDCWKEGARPARKKVALDSRHGILAGTLATTAIFGFPVFCLVCPVGLTFATFILFWRLVQFNEPSWGLLLFPLIIAVEVLVLRKWCGRICPMGALMSLISSLNKTFRPTVDNTRCLRDVKGTSCHACDAACPEHIDPYANLGARDMTECVKCRSCADACPAAAIRFPIFQKNASANNSAHNEENAA